MSLCCDGRSVYTVGNEPHHGESQMSKIDNYLADAGEAFEAGFASKAAQKRAQDSLNRAYNLICSETHDKVRDHVFATVPANEPADYEARNRIFRANDLPFDLHQVRDSHIEIIGRWTGYAQMLRDMIALRAAIKAAEITPPQKDPAAERVEGIRQGIIAEMERRKAQFVEALEIGRLFNGLPVTVNAHWVHGHKGTTFLRHFFYLSGKLTPLNVILAAADTLERETEVRA
jgi:hypothetical protein